MKKHNQIVFSVLIVFGMSKMLSAQDTSAVGAQDTSVVKSAPKTKNVAALNYELYNELGESQREWLPFLLIGAGYSQRLCGNVYAFVEVLFDVLQSDKSPYRNWEPFTSIGIGAGF
jgi:hypothetical protein